MKTLYIIRHAKSAWDRPELSDFNRPLNERGKKEAKRTGKWLAEHEVCPNLVLSSPAKRAKSTIKRVCKQIEYPFEKVAFEHGIYDHHMDGVDWYLAYLMDIDDRNDTIFIVWHNNAWDQLWSYLAGRDIWHLLPGWIFLIQFDVNSWSEISYWNGNLQLILNPKELK